MNSIRRGAPVPVAPVFRIELILPKLPEGTPPLNEPRLVEGLPHCGWLSKLNAAARKLKLVVSVILKFFVSELSIS